VVSQRGSPAPTATRCAAAAWRSHWYVTRPMCHTTRVVARRRHGGDWHWHGRRGLRLAIHPRWQIGGEPSTAQRLPVRTGVGTSGSPQPSFWRSRA
jgi:hypothetical protein